VHSSIAALGDGQASLSSQRPCRAGGVERQACPGGRPRVLRNRNKSISGLHERGYSLACALIRRASHGAEGATGGIKKAGFLLLFNTYGEKSRSVCAYGAKPVKAIWKES
jgi:hypothetical protein